MSADPLTAGLDLGTELLKFLSLVSKYFPDYKESKLEDYHYHHDRYVEELKKDIPNRDDSRIDYHKDQMTIILHDFSEFLVVKEVKTP